MQPDTRPDASLLFFNASGETLSRVVKARIVGLREAALEARDKPAERPSEQVGWLALWVLGVMCGAVLCGVHLACGRALVVLCVRQ